MAYRVAVLSAVLLLSGVLSVPLVENSESLEVPEEDYGWSSASSVLRECDGKDIVACLGAKAVGYLDRASRMGNMEIYDGIVLVGNVDRSGRAMTENEIENDIQTSPEGKASRLLDLIADSVSRFFRTHYMEFKMPESVQESLEEGRQKNKRPRLPKRKGLRRLMPMLFAAKTYLTALLAKLGVIVVGKIALKAAILAKIALAIGAYLLYRSTQQTEHHHSAPVEYHSSSSSNWGPYQRSIEDAHEMAYAAYAPENVKTE